MCIEIMIFEGPDNGHLVDKTNELELSIGFRPIDRHGSPVGAEETCLCPVDLAATARIAGYELIPGWDSCGCDFVMKPIGMSLRAFTESSELRAL